MVLLCSVRRLSFHIRLQLTNERVNPHEIPWEDYKAWRSSLLQTTVGEQAAERLATLDFRPEEGTGTEDQPLSFSRLCELISQGRTNEIPGIKEIPDELNVDCVSNKS